MENTKNKNLISISGKAGSGKDTVGKIIQYLMNPFDRDMNTQFDILEDYSSGSKFEIKRFADKLKDIVCILIGCTREQLEDREFKEKELGEEWWYWKDKKLNKICCAYLETSYQSENHQWTLIKLTPRKLLQLMGTEVGRDIIHPNLWVNALFSEYILKKFSIGINRYGGQTIVDKYPNWIITDMRFSNELKAVEDRGGITIKVNRHPRVVKHSENASYVPNPLFDKEHPSETALDNAKFDYTINNNSSTEDLIEKVREILIKEKII